MPDLPEDLEPLTDLIHHFDHVALAVHDLRSAVRLFEFLGGAYITGDNNLRQGFAWVHYRLPGGTKIEALAPTTEDTFLRSFLESRGEGVHHLTFRVSSVPEAARRAEETGLKVVRLSVDPDWSECFIHPSSALGTVVQLAEWPDGSYPSNSLEDVLEAATRG